MKKLFLILAGFTLLLASCKKENIEKSALNVQHYSDNRVSSLIKKFKASANSEFKSDEVINVDSAIWYINTSINYSYSQLTLETEYFITDSCTVILPVCDSMTTLQTAYEVYEEVVDSLRLFYSNIASDDKALYFTEINHKNSVNDQMEIEVIATYSYAGPTPVTCTFPNTDSYCFWYYWEYHPICAGNTLSTEVTDAANETMKRIMRCKGVPGPGYYYEPGSSIYIDNPLDYPINTGIGTPISNHRYSHLYWNCAGYPNFSGCIPPSDLNFYLSQTQNLIYKDVTNGGIRPIDQQLVRINLEGKTGSYQGYLVYKHVALVEYGYLRYNPDPKDEL